MDLWYKHHQEACFVIEGAAIVTERDTGAVTHRIGPGDAYAPGTTATRSGAGAAAPGLRLQPRADGRETHDADGSYELAD